MKKLDKKQIPQFAALCILSAGLFGYFVVRLVTPSPAAAGTLPKPVAQAAKPASAAPQTATAPGAATTAAAPGTAATAAGPSAAAPAQDAVPPPTPGMRDPFVVSAMDTKATPATPAPAAVPKPAPPATQMASLPALRPLPLPNAPALPPALSSFAVKPRAEAPALPPAPVAPPAPAWTVTGVLQGETDKVAILRNGEARMIVRTGDFVDGLYRVVDVTRTAVTLRHGPAFYQLNLGAAPAGAAPARALPAGPSPALFAPKPAAPAARRPRDAAFAPTRRSFLSLAQAGRSLMQMASGYAAQAALRSPAAGHMRVTDPTHVAMRFLDDQTPIAGADDARARLAAGVTLYRNGQRLQARAEWERVQEMADYDAADEAKKLLYRYP